MKIKVIYVLLFVAFIILTYFFVMPNTEHKIGKTIVIAAYGDSLTDGLGVVPEDAYPSQMAEKLRKEGYKIEMLNFGISGDTSEEALARIDEVLDARTDIAILEIGANDGFIGVDPKKMKTNIDLIIKTLKASNIEVLLVGMRLLPGRGFKYSADFKKVFEDLAHEHHLIFMPYILGGIALRPDLNLGDGIHPNRDGYKKVVSEMYPYVLKTLKRLTNQND